MRTSCEPISSTALHISPGHNLECIAGDDESLGAVGKLDLEAVMILAVIDADSFYFLICLQNRDDFTWLKTRALRVRRRYLVYAVNLRRRFDQEDRLGVLAPKLD